MYIDKPMQELDPTHQLATFFGVDKSLTAGSKFDGAKNRLELVDALAVEGIGAVLTFGAKKYAANNWRNGIEYTRLIGALKRHLSAIEKGEDTDPESHLPHIDHLGCEWMFLSNFMKTRPDLDDRWKGNNGTV